MSPVSHHDPVAYTKSALDIDFVSAEDVNPYLPKLEFFDTADGNAPGRGLDRISRGLILISGALTRRVSIGIGIGRKGRLPIV
jgi:hypothetical protein